MSVHVYGSAGGHLDVIGSQVGSIPIEEVETQLNADTLIERPVHDQGPRVEADQCQVLTSGAVSFQGVTSSPTHAATAV